MERMKVIKCIDSVIKKQEQAIRKFHVQNILVKTQDNNIISYPIHVASPTTASSYKKIKTSDQKQKSKMSTRNYRDKKKKDLIHLQAKVKQLQTQLVQVDISIQSIKQNILLALQTLAKMNQRSSSENIQIYNQLQIILEKCQCKTPEKIQQGKSIQRHGFGVDYDKINLLLDTLKYRIGASGSQRQSKLNYHFQSIVNTFFPALYRYILEVSVKNIDLFEEGNAKPAGWQWTNQLISQLTMEESQVEQLRTYKIRLNTVYNDTVNEVAKLNNIKSRLKHEGMKVQGVEQQIRQIINPIQCAHFTIFAEKNKYRRELLLDVSSYSKIKYETNDEGFIERIYELSKNNIGNRNL